MRIAKVKTVVTLPVLEVLAKATGQDHGADPAAWAAWWQKTRKSFSFPG